MASDTHESIFTSMTLPDISSKSHIIGLVGTHDNEDLASPQQDGWFLSDFYLFKSLLDGLCQTRAWFTCLDPAYLVEKYTEYVHGSPYQERRIVLDRLLLESGQCRQDMTVVKEDELLAAFLTYFRGRCQQAQAAREPVLLLLLGHGDEMTSGIEIGVLSNGSIPMLSIPTIKDILQQFPDLQLSALLTSCYSGGWTTYLNITAMTAAGPSSWSESWPISHSIGRATGSIFASAVVERLRKDDHAVDCNKDPVSYEQFTSEVKAKLMLLDKFGAIHDIRFSAQDDDWENEFHQRSGLPRFELEKRLLSLRTIPRTNREEHPHGDRTSDEQLQRWNQPCGAAMPGPAPIDLRNPFRWSMRGRHGGSGASILSLMRKRAQRYLASCPGRDSIASNHTVHYLARRCLDGKCSWDEMTKLAACLDYREKTMQVARKLLIVMDVGPFLSDWSWDPHSWLTQEGVIDRIGASDSAVRRIINANLIPKPGKDEGRFSMKPVYYLCAALYAKNLDETEIDKRIDRARQCMPFLNSIFFQLLLRY